VTYHVVIAFDRDAEGDLKPGEAREVLSVKSATHPLGFDQIESRAHIHLKQLNDDRDFRHWT
jgi:hypothetical protein